MNPFIFKKNSFNHLAYFIQILLLVVYLSLNIINVGQDGTALPLLAGFVFFAGYYFLLALLKYRLTIRKHFFVFLLFVFWMSLRIIIDLQDLEHLKQITIATTGGVLLFFLIGTFVRKALDNTVFKGKIHYYKLFLILYFIIGLSIFMSFKARLTRLDIFYIEGVAGGYQRPGNFMIMLFDYVIYDCFICFYYSSNTVNYKKNNLFYVLAFYIQFRNDFKPNQFTNDRIKCCNCKYFGNLFNDCGPFFFSI